MEAKDIWRGIWLEEAHHSTAIEGNTLVLKQVEQLLNEGRAVGDKELREYMEVQGYGNAADWVYSHGIDPGGWSAAAPLTLTDLRHVHRLALDLVWDVAPHPQATSQEEPGSFRQHDIAPFPGGMRPPPFPDIPHLISDWLRETEQLPQADPLTFPEALARIHAGFEQIHPFLDGNGRTGRLILNLLLIRLGYPPAIIYKRERSQYLKALRRADRSDYGSLGELLARAVLHNLYRFVVPAIAGPARLVPLPALADGTLSASALRVAAARGRLEASKGADGTWRSSRAWVETYKASRTRRGRTPASLKPPEDQPVQSVHPEQGQLLAPDD
jgi:fido (protein-threonine AMPylation protein)